MEEKTDMKEEHGEIELIPVIHFKSSEIPLSKTDTFNKVQHTKSCHFREW